MMAPVWVWELLSVTSLARPKSVILGTPKGRAGASAVVLPCRVDDAHAGAPQLPEDLVAGDEGLGTAGRARVVVGRVREVECAVDGLRSLGEVGQVPRRRRRRPRLVVPVGRRPLWCAA